VPIEAKIEDEVGVQYETTRLADVVTALNYARGVKIMVLDACRNNPFVNQLARRQATRGFSVGSGLAPVARAQGMVIAYATQANDVAADGAGRNSPFPAALVREIDQPGLEVATLFRRVQKSVYDATSGRQTPELSLSLLGDFSLNREETDADVWRRIHAALVEIDTVDHLEADFAERHGHVAGVVDRIRQDGRVAIAGITDDERNAALWSRRRHGQARQHEHDQPAESGDEDHDPLPCVRLPHGFAGLQNKAAPAIASD
jgi:hypothetical protein